MNKIPFLAMFFEYQPSGELLPYLDGAEILHAEILREKRQLNLTVSFLQYIPDAYLRELKNELQRVYSLKGVEILPKLPREEFPKLDGRELSRMMVRDYSPCSAILAGCNYLMQN